MHIIFIVLAIISLRYSSGLEADDTSYLPSGSVLSGGEYVGNDLLTSPNQARPVNSSLQKAQKLNPFNWAVTSFQENNTALAVCFRQEIRARKYLLKYLISIEILNNTKHRESKICSRNQETKPKTLLVLNSQDPSQNQSNRYLIRVSGLNTTLRAVHILKYSAHAVCFRNETMIESIERKEEGKNEMKVTGRSIHLPIRLNTVLPVDLYIYRGMCKNEDLKIYLRGFQQKYYQRKGTNLDLPKPTIKREDRCKLSELVLKEERLTNNLWADQWKHSALAVCFLFYGKEEVVTPQDTKLMMHYNTNQGDELYSCLRELVLYLVKEMQLYHPKLNRSQRRKKLKSKTYKKLVYRERIRRSKSFLFKLLLRNLQICLTIATAYWIFQSLIKIVKLKISMAPMKLKRLILVIIISGLSRVDEMMEEESAEIERVEERNQKRFEVFVRDFEGRTTVVEVKEDDTGKEVIERFLSKKPTLQNTCLRMNNGPKPIKLHMCLRDQGVSKGDTLEIQLEMPGGMKARTLKEIIAEKKLVDEQNARLEKEIQEAEQREEETKRKEQEERAKSEEQAKQKAEAREANKNKPVTFGDLDKLLDEVREESEKKVPKGDMASIILAFETKRVQQDTQLKNAVEYLKNLVELQDKKIAQQEETIQLLWNDMKEMRALLGEKEIRKPEEKVKSIQPMTTLNISKYNKELDWREWQKDFEFEAMIGQWTEAQKLSNLMYYLSDDIRKICKEMTKEQIQSYDLVIAILMNNYGSVKKRTRLEYEREFLNLTMSSNTPVTNFMQSIKNMAMLAEIENDARVVERFTEGLRPKEVLSATRRACKERGCTTSEEVLKVALEEQKKYLEEKQLLDSDNKNGGQINNNSPKTNCKSCDVKLDRGEILFCKNCKDVHNKKKGLKVRPETRTDTRTDMRTTEEREKEAEILKKKPSLGLKHEELRDQERCFFCTEKLSEHSTRSCRDKYPDLRPYLVREKLRKGIEVPESKNEGDSRTQRASGS